MNSFKGSISAVDASYACFRGIKRVFPDAVVKLCPVSDGGDGLIEVIFGTFGGKIHFQKVAGPLLKPVLARYLMLGKTAVLEISEAVGVKYLKPSEFDCMNATSFGVGEVMRDAVLNGASHILVGLGGSASNDAGIGCAQGFGFKLLDKSGNEISRGIKGLFELAKIEKPEILKIYPKLEITGICDVDNPLCGKNGSARVYAPQKGANPQQVKTIERGLLHFSKTVKTQMGKDVAYLKGGAAAGGLGAGLVAFFHAKLVRGSDYVLKMLNMDKHIKWADLIITGEGKFDNMSFFGKAPIGVCGIAVRYHKPVLMVCAVSEVSDRSLLARHGIKNVIQIKKTFKNKNTFLNTSELIQRGIELEIEKIKKIIHNRHYMRR